MTNVCDIFYSEQIFPEFEERNIKDIDFILNFEDPFNYKYFFPYNNYEITINSNDNRSKQFFEINSQKNNKKKQTIYNCIKRNERKK